MNQVVTEHYTRLGKQYDGFLYYSDEFLRAQTRKMIELLELLPNDLFVDLGCGTGMYSLDILKQISLKRLLLGVDPF